MFLSNRLNICCFEILPSLPMRKKKEVIKIRRAIFSRKQKRDVHFSSFLRILRQKNFSKNISYRNSMNRIEGVKRENVCFGRDLVPHYDGAISSTISLHCRKRKKKVLYKVSYRRFWIFIETTKFYKEYLETQRINLNGVNEKIFLWCSKKMVLFSA